MKKGVLLVLLTYVVAAHSANCLILSSHWSVTSKVIALMLSSLGFSSAGLLVILASLGIWNTTSSRAGSNRLASLRAAEERIAQSKAGTIKTSDKESSIWEAHGVYCDGYCCMGNPSNKIYN